MKIFYIGRLVQPKSMWISCWDIKIEVVISADPIDQYWMLSFRNMYMCSNQCAFEFQQFLTRFRRNFQSFPINVFLFENLFLKMCASNFRTFQNSFTKKCICLKCEKKCCFCEERSDFILIQISEFLSDIAQIQILPSAR